VSSSKWCLCEALFPVGKQGTEGLMAGALVMEKGAVKEGLKGVGA
jgi:hypothetical protein